MNAHIEKSLNKKHGITITKNRFEIPPQYLDKVPSTLSKYVSQSLSSNVEKNLTDSCSKNSLFSQGIKRNVNGINVVTLPKGTSIYKIFNGYFNSDDIFEYWKKNKDTIYWFGNKNFVYLAGASTFTGINAFKLVQDLNLVDLYEENNLKKFIEFSKRYKDKQLPNIVRFLFGYEISLEDQAIQLYKLTRWTDLWHYDKPLRNEFVNYDCEVDTEIKKVKPLSRFKSHYYWEKIKMKDLYLDFVKKYELDGYMRHAVYSPLETNGYMNEEIIIPGDKILSHFIADDTDLMTWKNWLLPKKIVDNKKLLDNFSFSGNSMGGNFKFKKILFWLKNSSNKLTFKKVSQNSFTMCSYNIHYCENINGMISHVKNFDNIIELFKNKSPDILVIQEINKIQNGQEVVEIDEIYAKIKNSLNYNYHYAALNGSKNTYMAVFTKIKPNNTVTIDVTVDDSTPRQIVILEIYGIKIACVHLEIGKRYIKYKGFDKEKYKKLINENKKLRKTQLQKIISHNVDAITGDFNFSYNNGEFKYMSRNNFNCPIFKRKSTPYNNVDHVFYKNGINLLKSKLIKCNYSDHLPLMLEIEKIRTKNS